MKRKMRRLLAVLLVFALTFSMAGTDVLAAGVGMAQEAVSEETAQIEDAAEGGDLVIIEQTAKNESADEAGLADETTEPAETGETNAEEGSGEGTGLPKMSMRSALRAPGSSETIFSEDFEDARICPEGWTVEENSTTVTWTTAIYNSSYSSGSSCGTFVDWESVDNGLTAWLITPARDFSNVTGSLKLTFWYKNPAKSAMGGIFDELCVCYRIGGGEWRELFRTAEGKEDWTKQILILPEGAKAGNVEIGFCGTNHDCWGINLDDVVLEVAESLQTHSVTYHANGGSGAMTDTNSPYFDGSGVYVMQNAFQAPAGKGFVKWNTKADGSGINYVPNNYFFLTQDVTFYAQWGYPISGVGEIANGRVYCARSAALAGETITLGVYPDDYHYVLKRLTVRNGSEIAAVTKVNEEKYTFVMPEGGVAIEATFQKVDVAFNEDFTDMGGWTFVDADGDNDGWYIPSDTYLSPRLMSNSYKETANDAVAVTPDNWAITPAIELPDNPVLTFKILEREGQNMAVYVGNSPNVNAMTKVSDYVTEDTFTRYWVDLSDYAGQTVYVGFRHYNVTDKLGDVTLIGVTVYGEDLGTIDLPGVVRSYDELKEKINEANNGNSEDFTYLRLSRDITTDEVDVIDIGKVDNSVQTGICLDLAGHTITSTATSDDWESCIFRLKHGSLIIEDNVGGGGIKAKNVQNVFLCDNSVKPCYLAIYDGTLKNTHGIIGMADGDVTVEIYGGRFESGASTSVNVGLNKTQFTPKLTVYGGWFNGMTLGYGTIDLRECTIEKVFNSRLFELGSFINPNSRVVLNDEVVTDLSVQKLEGTIVIEDKNKLRFVMHPQDKTCREGEGVTFIACAENATGYHWYVEDENGNPVSAVEKGWASGSSYNYAPNGAGGTSFTLTGIKEGLDGKKVYCVAEGNGQLAESARAEIRIDQKVNYVCVEIENLKNAVLGANVKDFMTANVLNSQGKKNPHASATVSWYPEGSGTQVTDHVFGPNEKWNVYVTITLADGYEFTDDATCRVLNVNGETVAALREGQSHYDPTWARFSVSGFEPYVPDPDTETFIELFPADNVDRFFPGRHYNFVWRVYESSDPWVLAGDSKQEAEFTCIGNTDEITTSCEPNCWQGINLLGIQLGQNETAESITIVARSKADPSKTGYYVIEVTQAPQVKSVGVVNYGYKTGETAILVTWGAPELLKDYPESHFILYREEGDGVWNVVNAQKYDESVTGYQYYDNEVTAGKAYKYAVVCTDRGYRKGNQFWPTGREKYDQGKPTYSQAVIAQAAGPLQPKNVTVTQEGKAFRISWDECGGAKSYRIAKVSAETPPNFWGTNDFTELVSGLTETTYLDEDVQEGITYGYLVYAVNKDGETQESSLNARKRKVTLLGAVTDENLRVAKKSLTLYDTIAIDFKVPKAAFEGYRSPCLLVTQNGVAGKISSYREDGDLWIFTYRVAPHMMGDEVTAVPHALNEEGREVLGAALTYSVKSYCKNMLNNVNYQTDDYAMLRRLLVDILLYGEAAQLYSGYKTDNLVSSFLSDEQRAMGTDVTAAMNYASVRKKNCATVENPLASIETAALFLEAAVDVQFKYEADDLTGLRVVVTEDEAGANVLGEYPADASLIDGNGRYYVTFDYLNAAQMRKTVYATVMKGSEKVSNTFRYSIESYVYSMTGREGYESLGLLLDAMMRYGDSAATFAEPIK